MKHLVKASLVFLLVFLFLSCGKKSSPPPGDGGINGENNDPLKVHPFIVGDVARLDTNVPLVNYTVVIYNIDTGVALTSRTNESGVFEIPMEDLAEGENYQLYLLDAQDNYLSGIEFDGGTNLSSPTPITYETIDDFDLGHLKIAYGTDGTIDITESQLHGSLGAGFTLMDGQINPVTLGSVYPTWIGSVRSKRGIYAFDPQVLLSHYLGQNSLNMSYQNFQIIQLTLTPSSSVTLLSAFALSSSSWQSDIKDSKNLLLDLESAALWQANSAAFVTREDTILAATLYANATLTEAKVLFISAFEQDGETATFPIKLNFSEPLNPPTLATANEAGTTEIELDFSDSSAANGLTRPFCIPTGDFVLGLKPPALLNSSEKQIFENINMQFAYYDTGLTSLEYQLNDWPEDWQTATVTEIATGTAKWFPEEALWSVELNSTEKQKAQHTVTIPQKIFLSQLASSDTGVAYVKVIVSYENSTHISAASYWFKFCDN